MAWILLTGEDVDFYQNALQMLRPAGHQLVATADGRTALQLLVDIDRNLIVLLRQRMGQMAVDDFLSAVAVDGTVRWRHAYLLLDGPLSNFSVDIKRHLVVLAAPIVATPADASDVDGWADLLDAIDLADGQLPSKSSS